MAHARNHEDAARGPHRFGPAVGVRQPLVVAQGVEGREPGVAEPVVEQDLAAVAEEAGERRPAGGGDQVIGGIVADPRRRGVHVHLRRGVGTADRDHRTAQEAGDPAALSANPGIVREGGIDLGAALGPGACEGRAQGADLGRAEAGVGLGAFAGELERIETAGGEIEDQPVLAPVQAIAVGEKPRDHKLFVCGR